ncbi:MAG: DMT family transporter [Pseudomonadota bacterium]
MSAADNTLRGIAFMIATTLIFGLQDAVTRYLAGKYGVLMIVMVRYWIFGLFVVWLAIRQSGSIRQAARTSFPRIQILRGLLLVIEICVMVWSFVLLGLVETHAVFICYPLIVAALSGPILGENVGWRRWFAISIGFLGVLLILRPGFAVFDPLAIVPFLAASLFAIYSLLTRFVSRKDDAATSFFWTGTVGACAATLIGVSHWSPMGVGDWGWMAVLSGCALLGHWFLIKAYEAAEASAVQPFAYLQLVWGTILGVSMFNEVVEIPVAAGAAIILAAGLFTFWRERRTKN